MKSAMTQLPKQLFLLLVTHYSVRFVLDPVVDHLRARFIPAVHAASLDSTRHANYISHMPFITGGTTTSATPAATISDTLATAQLKSNERRHQISDDDDDGDRAAYCREGCEGSTNGICYDWCVYFCARRPPV